MDEHIGGEPRSWMPWTHKPYCANSTLCVYTNARVLGNRGISIVATPEIAASSLSLLEHAIGASFPDSSKVYGTQPPPYELREFPGQGKGLMATKKIPADMVIMIDSAIMVTQ